MTGFVLEVKNWGDVGAIATAVVMGLTCLSAIAAAKSAKLANKALKHAQQNSKKDEFNRHFTLLLEQHQFQQLIVKDYLDIIQKSDSGEFYRAVYSDNHHNAWRMMRGHEIFSPYMRVLYHLMKHIDDYYNGDIVEVKKYSSIVRSLIRNDIMYLIALNVSHIKDGNEYNQFDKFQNVLVNADFFAHANFNYNKHQDLVYDSEYIKTACNNIHEDLLYSLLGLLGYNSLKRKRIEEILTNPFILSIIIKNPLQNKAVRNFRDVLDKSNELYEERKNKYLKDNLDATLIEVSMSKFLGCYIRFFPGENIPTSVRNSSFNSDSFTKMNAYHLNYALNLPVEERNNESLGGEIHFYPKNENISYYYSISDFWKHMDEYISDSKLYNAVLNDEIKFEFDEEVNKWDSVLNCILEQSLLLNPPSKATY